MSALIKIQCIMLFTTMNRLCLSIHLGDIVIKLSGRLRWDFLGPNNWILNPSTVSRLSDMSSWNMLLPWSLLCYMSIPISPGTSLDTTSIEDSWFPNTIFVLLMDGQGLPSPNIYECVDLLRLSGFPPSLINALSLRPCVYNTF